MSHSNEAAPPPCLQRASGCPLAGNFLGSPGSHFQRAGVNSKVFPAPGKLQNVFGPVRKGDFFWLAFLIPVPGIMCPL